MTSFDDWLAHEAEFRQAAGLQRNVPEPDEPGTIDLAGNDYLGLARDPRVVKAAAEAAHAWGAGAGASRLVTGTMSVHSDLEHALAEWTGQPAGLALSTGYHANLAAITALTDADTLIVSDAHVHASLVDGCRLSKATTTVVPHSDLTKIEAALTGRTQPRAMVVVESIYSVLGDAAPLNELVDLCARHDATLLVDEAHGVGVAGGGHGLVHASGLAGRPHVVVTATLSKSLGSQGGAVLGSPAVIDQVVNRGRPFIYDTGLAPASAGAAAESLGLLAAEPERVQRLRHIADALADACGIERPAGAVMSVPMAGPREALDAQAQCLSYGVRVGCFRPPSTPDGSSRLRITASARLSDADVERAVEVLSTSRHW